MSMNNRRLGYSSDVLRQLGRDGHLQSVRTFIHVVHPSYMTCPLSSFFYLSVVYVTGPFFIHPPQVGIVFYLILFKSSLVAATDGSYLGPFAELRKPTVSFVMSVCLSLSMSVRPSVCLSVRMEQLGSTLDGFSWDLISEYFSKISRKFKFH
jgi:hypothetical protein